MLKQLVFPEILRLWSGRNIWVFWEWALDDFFSHSSWQAATMIYPVSISFEKNLSNSVEDWYVSKTRATSASPLCGFIIATWSPRKCPLELAYIFTAFPFTVINAISLLPPPLDVAVIIILPLIFINVFYNQYIFYNYILHGFFIKC